MSGTREALEPLLGGLRPKLHRYCARMAGSAADGEDIVQDTLLKAVEALRASGPIANPEAWLFRVAHNTALDFLRWRNRANAGRSDEDPETLVDPGSTLDSREAVNATVRTFLRLPVGQRSAVILMDVLGYSVDEIGGITQLSVPAVKALLHRGRTRLRELADQPGDTPVPRLDEADRDRLTRYVDRFNARDFDAIRDMLAAEVRLELVNRTRLQGRDEVGRYFHNYAAAADWELVAGFVDGRAAVLVRNPRGASAGWTYFVLLEWAGDQVAAIRDFRHAAYTIDSADVVAPAC
jgi:RNA polymerase sigma-70 factor (ECF subfamily)